jgi:hypothetical protein
LSKQTREFLEQLKSGEQSKLVETIREAAASLKDIGGKIWDGVTPSFEHGAHEMASALFRGDAFVMYPRTNQAEGQQQESQHEQQRPEQQQEQSRGGREM